MKILILLLLVSSCVLDTKEGNCLQSERSGDYFKIVERLKRGVILEYTSERNVVDNYGNISIDKNKQRIYLTYSEIQMNFKQIDCEALEL